MINTPRMILIHCTDISEKASWNQFAAVDKYHKSLDFLKSSLGFYVGYHRLITGGVNYKCKEDNEEGSHCNQSENGISVNLQSLAVCVGFDGDIEFPNTDHYNLLRSQVLAWQAQYNIPDDMVLMHRHFALYKTCPGSLIKQTWIDTLIDKENIPVSKMPDQKAKQSALINIQSQLTFLEQAAVKLQNIYNLIFKKQ